MTCVSRHFGYPNIPAGPRSPCDRKHLPALSRGAGRSRPGPLRGGAPEHRGGADRAFLRSAAATTAGAPASHVAEREREADDACAGQRERAEGDRRERSDDATVGRDRRAGERRETDEHSSDGCDRREGEHRRPTPRARPGGRGLRHAPRSVPGRPHGSGGRVRPASPTVQDGREPLVPLVPFVVDERSLSPSIAARAAASLRLRTPSLR